MAACWPRLTQCTDRFIVALRPCPTLVGRLGQRLWDVSNPHHPSYQSYTPPSALHDLRVASDESRDAVLEWLLSDGLQLGQQLTDLGDAFGYIPTGQWHNGCLVTLQRFELNVAREDRVLWMRCQRNPLSSYAPRSPTLCRLPWLHTFRSYQPSCLPARHRLTTDPGMHFLFHVPGRGEL